MMRLDDAGWGARGVCRAFRTIQHLSRVSLHLRVQGGTQQATGVQNLVSRMTALTTLEITACRVFGTEDELDLSSVAEILASIPDLRVLDVHEEESWKWKWDLPVARLSRLEVLCLPTTKGLTLKSYAGLQSLSFLRHLELFHHRSDLSVDALSSVTSLTRLYLRPGGVDKPGNITCVDALAHLTNMRSLDLSQHRMTTLDALSTLTALTSLCLNKCERLRSLRVLTALSSLKELSCMEMGSALEQEPVFTSLVQLESLSLDHFRYRGLQIASLACLTSLVELHMPYCWALSRPYGGGLEEIYDVTPLTTLQSLKVLIFREADLLYASTEVLKASLTNLEFLCMCRCGRARGFRTKRTCIPPPQQEVHPASTT